MKRRVLRSVGIVFGKGGVSTDFVWLVCILDERCLLSSVAIVFLGAGVCVSTNFVRLACILDERRLLSSVAIVFGGGGVSTDVVCQATAACCSWRQDVSSVVVEFLYLYRLNCDVCFYDGDTCIVVPQLCVSWLFCEGVVAPQVCRMLCFYRFCTQVVWCLNCIIQGLLWYNALSDNKVICTLNYVIIYSSMDGSSDSVVPNHWPYTSTTWSAATVEQKHVLSKRYMQLYQFKLLAWEASGLLPGQSDDYLPNCHCINQRKTDLCRACPVFHGYPVGGWNFPSDSPII